MRARELQAGQEFFTTWLGIATSPYLTACAVERSGDVICVTLPDESKKTLRAKQRIRLAKK
jgi:hypothetical protein